MRGEDKDSVGISCVAVIIWALSALVSVAFTAAVIWGIVKLITWLTAQ